MTGWGKLTPENIHEFAQQMATEIGMDESQKESLSSGITKRVSKFRARSESTLPKVLSPRDSKNTKHSPRDNNSSVLSNSDKNATSPQVSMNEKPNKSSQSSGKISPRDMSPALVHERPLSQKENAPLKRLSSRKDKGIISPRLSKTKKELKKETKKDKKDPEDPHKKEND